MRRYIILVLAMMCCFICGYAQRYASRMTQDGTIYFINPQKLKKVAGIKSFEYDVTLLTWTDSVTVNFTFESDVMLVPEKVSIVSGNDTFDCNNYRPLFIDLKKNHYEIRISALFSVSEFEKVIESEIPPRFVFYQEAGKMESAEYSAKSWKKERRLFNNIVSLYKYSK